MTGISCVCLTYGRTALVEEAIESFRRQKYTGLTELIVLNDCPLQKLVHTPDVPGLFIVNKGTTYASLGEKFNAAVSLCSHPLIANWSEDDISLPDRLIRQTEFMAVSQKVAVVERTFWYDGWKKLQGCIPALLITREAFQALGGFPADRSFDVLEEFYRLALNENMVGTRGQKDEVPQIIVRIPADSPRVALRTETLAQFYSRIDQRIEDGMMPGGEIVVTPRWRTDYASLAIDQTQKK